MCNKNIYTRYSIPSLNHGMHNQISIYCTKSSSSNISSVNYKWNTCQQFPQTCPARNLSCMTNLTQYCMFEHTVRKKIVSENNRRNLFVSNQQNNTTFWLLLRKRSANQNVLQRLLFETTATSILNKILEV